MCNASANVQEKIHFEQERKKDKQEKHVLLLLGLNSTEKYTLIMYQTHVSKIAIHDILLVDESIL